VNLQVKGKKLTQELLTRKTKMTSRPWLKMTSNRLFLTYLSEKCISRWAFFSLKYFLSFRFGLFSRNFQKSEQKVLLTKASKQGSHLLLEQLSLTLKKAEQYHKQEP